jgi:hypothetical protein
VEPWGRDVPGELTEGGPTRRVLRWVAHAFWRSKVDQGRTVAALGSTEGFAFCEWSAANDTDVTDPEPWWDFHPALGFTIAPETIAADLQSMPLAEWRRAYCSRWLDDADASGWGVIPRDAWEAAGSEGAGVMLLVRGRPHR